MKFGWIVLLMLVSPAFSQIKGVVVDKSSGKPVPSAFVFINQTTFGSKCNSKGEFSLEGLPTGFWDLVVAEPEHETFKSSIRVSVDKRYTLTLELIKAEPQPKVKFKPDEEWTRNFQWFERALLGAGPNAVNCVFKNEKTLRFSRSGEMLIASAPGPVIVESVSTGFRYNYYIQKFEAGVEQIKSEGFLFFDTIPTRDPSIRASWERARLRTYWGSMRHLFRTLITKTSREEGFELFDQANKRLIADSILVPSKMAGYYSLRLKGKTRVSYRIEKGNSGIRQTDKRGQTTWLTPEGLVDFNEWGMLFNAKSLAVQGQMALSRLSDELPINYLPTATLADEKMDWKNFGLLQERVYLQTDRDYYYPRENIWFKAYLGYARPVLRDTLSKTLYVELIGPDKKVFRSKVYRIQKGVTWGDFKLPDSLATGEYYLRAYTNWMKNYGDDYFFVKPVPVLSFDQNLVIKDARQSASEGDVKVTVSPDKQVYKPREELNVKVQVSQSGKPVASSLSVSVVDDFSSAPLSDLRSIGQSLSIKAVADTNRYFDEIKYYLEKGLSFKGVVKDERGRPTESNLDIIQGNMDNLISMETDAKGEFVVTGLNFQDSLTFAFKPVTKKGKALPKVEVLPRDVPAFTWSQPPLALDFRKENALQRVQNSFTVDDNTILLSEIEVKASRINEAEQRKGTVRVYGEADHVVKGDNLKATTAGQNFLIALQGRVPGVQVTESTDANGIRSVKVRLRGGSSRLVGNTDPLVLV
ncbi:MAG: carboxypeptidase regulatory-like domain-containing protein, partial [Cyclobacteriaceae bacterium]|nr:carboxypeptidase regulatory-like domain-containing protein [Cyclobacteriaceae bacterium]